MKTHNFSPNYSEKLQWTAGLLCVFTGLVILIWFGITLFYNDSFLNWWVLILTIYPITAFIAWRWSLTGGVIAALLSSFFIYLTLIDIHLHFTRISMQTESYIEPVLSSLTVAIWLFLSFIFLIGAIMRIIVGVRKQKNKGTVLYGIMSSFLKAYRWRLLIGFAVFLTIAGFSFTMGNTKHLGIMIPEFSLTYIRTFNRFLWLPYTGTGVLPWDEKGIVVFQYSYWGSHLLFALSILWWAFFSSVIVVLGSLIHRRYIEKR